MEKLMIQAGMRSARHRKVLLGVRPSRPNFPRTASEQNICHATTHGIAGQYILHVPTFDRSIWNSLDVGLQCFVENLH
jgi:hypothetical protein